MSFSYPFMSRCFVSWLDSVTQWLAGEKDVGAVVFTGVRNIFMTGADLAEVRQLNDREAVEDFLRLPHLLMQRIYSMDKITVAAINGHCLGGGLELALICDFRYAASDLREPSGAPLPYLGLPEVRLGLVPALGGAYRLIEVVGQRNASQMLYSGQLETAMRAWEMGLVDHLENQADLVSGAIEFCEKMLSHSPTALRTMKSLVASSAAVRFAVALREAGNGFAECCCSDDKNQRIFQFHLESVRSFRRVGA